MPDPRYLEYLLQLQGSGMTQFAAAPALPPPPKGAGEPSPGLTPWGMLARGNTLGKRGVIAFTPASFALGNTVQGRTDLLGIISSDLNAQPIQLTLASPRISDQVLTSALLFNIDNYSGTQDNIQSLGSTTTDFSLPYAQVQWGIGGVTHQAEVDILNGLSINLSASWLRVTCFVDACGVNSRGDPPATRIYELSATVGPGMPKPNNAQRTVFCAASLAHLAQTTVLPVPRFAKSITLSGTQGATALPTAYITLQRDAAPATNNPAGTFFWSGNGNGIGPFPIPNGALYFTVANISGAAIDKLFAIFELTI